jgi:hypothetical protein
MKMIVAVIKPANLEKVKDALEEIGIQGMTISVETHYQFTLCAENSLNGSGVPMVYFFI